MLTAEKKKYTVKDYEMLEEGAPFQLIEHDLVMSPSPLLSHQIILTNLIFSIKAFLKQTGNKGTLVPSPMDVYFDEGNIFQPDLLFISESRKDIKGDRVNGAPDMVIEILSPSNAYYDLRRKKDIYERFGVKEYIVIDPIAKDADLYTLADSVYVLGGKASGNGVLNSIVLPGYIFELNSIFEDVES